MTVLTASLIGVIAIALVFGFLIARAEGLTFLAPSSSKRISDSALKFCIENCRLVDGTCPLTGEPERARDCPLWQYVDADLPTNVYGSPFAHLQTR